MRLICRADGSFSFFSTNFGQYIPATDGTYTEQDGGWIFTVGEETYPSENQDGLQAVSLPVSLPVMGVSGIPTLMVQDMPGV